MNEDELEKNYPVIGSEKVRDPYSRKNKVENALLNCSRFPVEVWAFNFQHKISTGQSKNKVCCDILLLSYKKEEGSVAVGTVGTVVKKKLYHGFFNTEKVHNPFLSRSNSSKTREHANKSSS